MEKFELSKATMDVLNQLSGLKKKEQDIMIEEWCKCTGMD